MGAPPPKAHRRPHRHARGARGCRASLPRLRVRGGSLHQGQGIDACANLISRTSEEELRAVESVERKHVCKNGAFGLLVFDGRLLGKPDAEFGAMPLELRTELPRPSSAPSSRRRAGARGSAFTASHIMRSLPPRVPFLTIV